MNNRANFKILSKPNLIYFIIVFLIFGFWAFSQNKTDLTPVEETQNQISAELGTKTDTIIESLDSQRRAISFLNTNIKDLEKSKVDKDTENSLKYEVMDLSSNLEENNKRIQQINSDVNEIKATVKSIEPSYVQNIDLKDLRTYINIFRLFINFYCY